MAARENDSREDVCNTWNETFLDLNMRISDLAQPTEAFLTKTFVHYLRAFGYKVDPPYNLDGDTGADNSREKRIFLIKISRHIEHILQISVKSRTFSYYDLIKPTPKKTLNILDILYNYLCYFNMYKKDVFALVDEGLKKYDALQAQIAEIKQETEYRKNRAVELKTLKETLSVELTKLKPKLETLCSDKREKQKKFQKLKDEYEELKIQLSALQAQKSQWESLIVTDEEISALKAQIKKLDVDTNMCKQQVDEHVATLQERKIAIENNKNLCTKIDEAKEIVSSKVLTQFKESKKLYETTAKSFKTQENQFKKMKDTIEENKTEVKSLEQQLKERQQPYQQEKQAIQKLMAEKKNILFEHMKELETLKDACNDAQKELDKQELLNEDLHKFLASLFAKS